MLALNQGAVTQPPIPDTSTSIAPTSKQPVALTAASSSESRIQMKQKASSVEQEPSMNSWRSTGFSG